MPKLPGLPKMPTREDIVEQMRPIMSIMLGPLGNIMSCIEYAKETMSEAVRHYEL